MRVRTQSTGKLHIIRADTRDCKRACITRIRAKNVSTINASRGELREPGCGAQQAPRWSRCGHGRVELTETYIFSASANVHIEHIAGQPDGAGSKIPIKGIRRARAGGDVSVQARAAKRVEQTNTKGARTTRRSNRGGSRERVRRNQLVADVG